MSDPEAQIDTFSTSDGYVCHFHRYSPRGPVRGQVVALHGIQSHAGWYGGSCRYLAEVGWEVLFLERRGSGLNHTARGDAPSFRRLLTDIDEFIGSQCSEPPFLLAISWGAKLAVGLEYYSPGRTAGLVLVTPGICPKLGPSLGQRLLIGLTRLVLPRRLFPIPLSDPELFTTTPAWLDFLRTDPLALHQATARFLVESRRLDFYLRRASRGVQGPVLVALAGKDRIIDNGRTREYVAQFPTKDCRIVEYPGAHHTLEFEPDPIPIFRDVAQWLDLHSAFR
ncbi:MAG: alpha/beta fold hydrolase [Gemmataceae bacterium]